MPLPVTEDRISFHIESVGFKNGSRVAIPEGGIVVFVGANNAGKTESLRGIVSVLADKPSALVGDISIARGGRGELLTAWLEANGYRPERDLYKGWGDLVKADSEAWDGSQRAIYRFMVPALCRLATTAERLSVSQDENSFDRTANPPNSFAQALYADDELEHRIARIFEKVFRVSLAVDRRGGTRIPIRVGAIPPLEPGESIVSTSYLRRLDAVPRLPEQGDGMRSFFAAIMHVIVGPWFSILIDEPEAFLHPPQARALARLLVREKNEYQQLFIATHSTDFLHGILDAQPPRIKIIRLRRSGNTFELHEIETTQIRTLWDDPVLAFSNVLNGLFHERVVICEADGDSRFYSAVANAIASDGLSAEDAMFTSTGGKDKFPKVISALRALGVPVAAIADIDVLRGENLLKRIVDAAGGDWSTVEPYHRVVHAAVESMSRGAPLITKLRETINSLFNGHKGKALTEDLSDAIRNSVRLESGWDLLKRSGMAAIPSGSAQNAALQLLESLHSCGVYVVPVGELEGFDRTVGGHGTAWVAQVLQKDLPNDPTLEEARTFVRKAVLNKEPRAGAA